MTDNTNWQSWKERRAAERESNGGWAKHANFPDDVKQAAKERAGYRCQETLPSGKRCPRDANHPDGIQVDHVAPVAEGGTHDLGNARVLCKWHHDKKTQAEAQRGRARSKGQPRERRREQHPGMRR